VQTTGESSAHSMIQSEFEETILEDLSLLEIRGDKISHTSDYFDTLYDLAVKLIELGKAYADDTEQMQVSGMHLGASNCLPGILRCARSA
jgi:glutamyl/glutaminyl-tRNA synthetase